MRKVCTKCGKELPATKVYFHKQSSGKYGLRSWCKDCRKEHSRLKDTLRRYNITVNDYNKMFKDQKGRCAICGRHQIELDRRLCIDHNHKTDEIRGLLCNDCNSILGYSKDSQLILLKSIEYLRGK